MLAESLNAQLRTFEVRTGVYLSKQRNVCVVVRVKENKVYLLHFANCTVQLEVSFREKFMVDYPIQLYQYPAIRAVRKFAQYVREGFACTPDARKVINSILVR